MLIFIDIWNIAWRWFPILAYSFYGNVALFVERDRLLEYHQLDREITKKIKIKSCRDLNQVLFFVKT